MNPYGPPYILAWKLTKLDVNVYVCDLHHSNFEQSLLQTYNKIPLTYMHMTIFIHSFIRSFHHSYNAVIHSPISRSLMNSSISVFFFVLFCFFIKISFRFCFNFFLFISDLIRQRTRSFRFLNLLLRDSKTNRVTVLSRYPEDSRDS